MSQSDGEERGEPARASDNEFQRLPANERVAVVRAEILRNPAILEDPSIFDNPQVLRVVQVSMRLHRGPLPAPEDFAAYEDVAPGAAERILAMAEKAQGHNQQMNGLNMSKDYSEARLGQIFGFVIALVVTVGGMYLVTRGFRLEGTIFSGLGLVAVVAQFVQGKKRHQ